MKTLSTRDAAEMIHGFFETYRRKIGDPTMGPWHKLPKVKQKSLIAGVRTVLKNPDITPERQHDAWVANYTYRGWTYGPEVSVEKKQHPCIRPWDQLPAEQRQKDFLFSAMVNGLRPMIRPDRRCGGGGDAGRPVSAGNRFGRMTIQNMYVTQQF